MRVGRKTLFEYCGMVEIIGWDRVAWEKTNYIIFYKHYYFFYSTLWFFQSNMKVYIYYFTSIYAVFQKLINLKPLISFFFPMSCSWIRIMFCEDFTTCQPRTSLSNTVLFRIHWCVSILFINITHSFSHSWTEIYVHVNIFIM